MKLRLNDVRLAALLMAALIVTLLAGCARSPEGTVVAPVRAVTVEITLAAPPSNNLYYHMVIDTAGGGAGPIPVFPGSTPGQGWVTGSATHFVRYHQGQFTLFKFLDFDQFQFVQIGTPLRADVQGQKISFTIDLNDLGVTGNSIDVNFITLDDPFGERRTIDALITAGTSALNLDITKDDTISNARLGFIEAPDDLRNENGTPVPVTDANRALDMIDVSIGIDI